MTNQPFCPGFQRWLHSNRRQLLTAGSMSALGLGLGGIGTWTAASATPAIPIRAKRCIFLFMWGGPSQLENFDMKPEAPAEIRGEFKPASTAVPGIQICEHFTRLAKLTDRLTIIRSLGHDDPAHLSSVHATLTGNPAPTLKSDAAPPSDKDSPHLGSLLTRLRPHPDGMPSFVAMPWKANHPAAPGGEAPGQHGGWLGSAYTGMLMQGDPNHPDWKPQGLLLPAEISLNRLESCRQLLSLLESQRASLDRTAAAGAWSAQQSQAASMLTIPQVHKEFDLQAESDAMRDRYGRNIRGQCVLLAIAWVGEFGRRPQITAQNAGREHWPYCYRGLLAGGGIRRGHVHGESDRHAAYPIRDAVSPQHFAATMLHQLRIDPHQVLLDRENRPRHLSTGSIIPGVLA